MDELISSSEKFGIVLRIDREEFGFTRGRTQIQRIFAIEIGPFFSLLQRRTRAAQRFQTSYRQLYLSAKRAFDFSQRAHLSGFLGRDFFEYIEDAFGSVTIPKWRLRH